MTNYTLLPTRKGLGVSEILEGFGGALGSTTLRIQLKLNVQEQIDAD
jgi:hypothetical protein